MVELCTRSDKMVNFTIDQLKQTMKTPANVRNFSVIAHIDHGKSTLTDSLLAKAGIISQNDAGNKRYMMEREDEAARGITIKSSGVSLLFTQHGTDYVFNLIDSPGHVDFSSEVTAALRVTDGALVVVDCVEGAMVQTETVLRQAMQELIRPVLFLNKVDRCVFELEVDAETMYRSFVNTIESVNVVVSTYAVDEVLTDLNPVLGNVAFGSGKDCWAFTLDQFAERYSSKLNLAKDKLKERLWGDNFYDSETKQWKTISQEDEIKPTMKRGFSEFVMTPIIEIAQAALQSDKAKIQTIAKKLNVELTPQELEETGKKLSRIVLSKWMHAADCLINLCINHLPSPKTAQEYRYKHLYSGDLDDPAAVAIKNCDPDGPLVMYISKMLPCIHSGRFLAFGRVFSGTARVGEKVTILGPNFIPGSKIDLFESSITGCELVLGRKKEQTSAIDCGNTGALVGIDKYLLKNGTVTTATNPSPIRAMRYSVSPVVRVAVQPVNPNDIKKVADGLRFLSKVDNLVSCTINDTTGEMVVAGSGELHVSICLDDLEKFYAKVPIKRSKPIVPYRETVTEEGTECKSKSANKHNKLFALAKPLNPDFVMACEQGLLTPTTDKLELAKIMVHEYGFDKKEVASLWSFGPSFENVNLFGDATESCNYMKEIKDSCIRAFEDICIGGVLADEPLQGVSFELKDATIHADNAHRGPSQIIPTMKRTLYGSQLLAKPRILEPYYLLEVSVVDQYLGSVFSVISSRKGKIVDQISSMTSPLQTIKAYIPVAQSFDLSEDLREKTSGNAFPNMVFDHWEELEGDPLAATPNPANKAVAAVRLRKGLKQEIPVLDAFMDKF